jgi:hypothetical protein
MAEVMHLSERKNYYPATWIALVIKNVKANEA